MKVNIITIITGSAMMLSTVKVVAQDSISLQSAVDYALKHRNEIKIQQVNAEVSANEISKTNSRFLPTVSGTIDARYNGNLPIQIIPGEAFGSPGDPSRKVKFGTTYATAAGLDLNIPIFNPGDRGDKRVAQIQADYDKLNTARSEIDVKVDVMQSYFNLLIINEKMRMSKTNADHTLAVYAMSKDQQAKGAITRYDLEKSRINYENAHSDYEKGQNNYQLAKNDLAYRMGIDAEAKFVPADSLTELYAYFKEELDNNRKSERLELRQQRLLAQISEAYIKKERNSYLPTVSAYGNLTAQNLNNKYTLFNGASWYSYNYAGIRVSIPIFDGFSKQRTKHGYELQLKSAQLTADKLARDYNYEVQSTRTSVINDQKELDNQRNNLDNAIQLYSIDTDRLRQGAIKPTDLTATYYTLLQTQNNYLNAIYTYLMDIIQYKKAAGLY